MLRAPPGCLGGELALYDGRPDCSVYCYTRNKAATLTALDKHGLIIDLPALRLSADAERYPAVIEAAFGHLQPMMRVDTETGDIVRHDFGNRIAGEATFIPRVTSGGEAEDYLAVFAFEPVKETSDFVLLDATHLDADPVAVVRLPQRIPQGLHGNWIRKA